MLERVLVRQARALRHKVRNVTTVGRTVILVRTTTTRHEQQARRGVDAQATRDARRRVRVEATARDPIEHVIVVKGVLESVLGMSDDA